MKLEKILQAPNVAEILEADTLEDIGRKVCGGYDIDKQSRSAWEENNAEGLKLALQVVEAKSFPWPGASNVKYPLVTVACLQYNARAYPAIVPGRDIAKCRVIGDDPSGEKSARAKRVGTHMSWQLTEEAPEWEEDMDRLLMVKPLVGSVFKKTYFDPALGRNCSEMILPDNFVLDYYARSVDSARRKTHRLTYHKNELIELSRTGYFSLKEEKLTGSELQSTTLQDASDEAHGVSPAAETDRPYEVLEQHAWFDLDDDGYEEPYIVHVLKQTQEAIRISPRFEPEDIIFVGDRVAKIKPTEYFTKYGFIPSPDGSIYDLGFAILLGPNNRAVNSILNQLIDAGTLANAQGGLLARSVRIQGGAITVSPGKWHKTEASPEQLKNGVFPWPVREPSDVLFKLLSLLIDAGQKIGSTPEIMMGKSPGQNQPATTTMAMLEQGMQVFSAIYKRAYRSLTEELRKIYRLNRQFLDPETYFAVSAVGNQATAEKVYQADYFGDETDIAPVADPNVVSPAQRIAKAEAVVARSQANPLIYGIKGAWEAEKMYLEALQVHGIDNFLTPVDQIQPPQDPEIDLKAQELQDKSQREWYLAEMQGQRTMSNIEKDKANVIRTLANVEDQKVRTELESIKVALDDQHKQAELINERIKAQAQRHRDSGVAKRVSD